jgi:hypothetical protein
LRSSLPAGSDLPRIFSFLGCLSCHDLSGDELAPPPNAVTHLLMPWGKGDRAALDQLLPMVYRELHKIAKRYMVQRHANHILQTTAVIHEAYLKMAGRSEQSWENRAHFFGVATKAMAARPGGPCPQAGRRQAGRRSSNAADSDRPKRSNSVISESSASKLPHGHSRYRPRQWRGIGGSPNRFSNAS